MIGGNFNAEIGAKGEDGATGKHVNPRQVLEEIPDEQLEDPKLGWTSTKT